MDMFELFFLSEEELAEKGYEVCPHCDGYGSSLKEVQDKCSHCGGTGLKKKT